jgi:hypothetical protein
MIPVMRFTCVRMDWRVPGNGQIRQKARAGEKQIPVQALDSLAGITKLQGNPSHWVNNCAAAYYGVESIRAVEPILNPPVHH